NTATGHGSVRIPLNSSVQRKGLSTPAPYGIESAINSTNGGGKALSPSERSYFDPRFGTSFANVRLHTDSNAAQLSRSVNARAFTTGNNIYFGAGEYSPNSVQGKRLMAHELTHTVQQGNKKLLQKAEVDTVLGCSKLKDTLSDIDTKVNMSLDASRKVSGKPPKGLTVAKGIFGKLGADVKTGRTAIEVWANTLSPTKLSLPEKGKTKYAGVNYVIWMQSTFPILNPTMKVKGVCIGSDKLGHFFQQGASYFTKALKEGSNAAEESSERSEGGGFGLLTTGVFSNADLEANRQGGKFYKDLISNPAMTFSMAKYISSQWNEESNPNFYEEGVGRQVWANLLSGNWAGTSSNKEKLSITLNANIDGLANGTLSLKKGGKKVTGNILNGIINYKQTTVRGKNLFNSETNRSPISGIHIQFNWSLGDQSGKGYFLSSGERKLTGNWGVGNSKTDKGSLQIHRI
ncbi:MAG: DUF4157 domain-containing protein, partial [Leptospirales bacterium]